MRVGDNCIRVFHFHFHIWDGYPYHGSTQIEKRYKGNPHGIKKRIKERHSLGKLVLEDSQEETTVKYLCGKRVFHFHFHIHI